MLAAKTWLIGTVRPGSVLLKIEPSRTSRKAGKAKVKITASLVHLETGDLAPGQRGHGRRRVVGAQHVRAGVVGPGDGGRRGLAPAQRRGRPLGDDAPARDHRQTAREGFGLVEVVGGEQDGRAVTCQGPHEVPELASGLWVEPGCRLVEEEQLGVADDP